jgi:homogentisate 1,2-dioxygenase
VISDYDNEKDTIVAAKQLRWKAIPKRGESEDISFLDGMFSFCGAGSPASKEGLSILGYSFNSCMGNDFFYSADGDLLFVPQLGPLHFETEMGRMLVGIGEFGLIPRGIKFRIVIPGGGKKVHTGWISEIYSLTPRLPELGPIGANGLANPQDFSVPKAAYFNEKGKFNIYAKFLGKLFMGESEQNPLDIVSWRGNFYPYKYDFRNYNTMNTVSYDHPDPCIFTVLSSMSAHKGVAVMDLVIFKQRYMVAENTFRPPYYHRNVMAEFMGNIYGDYDAKSKGFESGCSSLHLPMTPHGPEFKAAKKAMKEELKPVKYPDTMSFMFESCYHLKIARKAFNEVGIVEIDNEYNKCWEGFEVLFDENKK